MNIRRQIHRQRGVFKKEKERKPALFLDRSDKIRTCGLYLPKVAL